MSQSPFARALESLLAPLRFAARDDFAHADRVRDLERTVREAAERALDLAIPPDARRPLEATGRRFGEALAGTTRRQAIETTLASLEPLAAPAWADRALARPLTTLSGVGPRRATALEGRGLRRITDLLFHLPAHYDDRRRKVRVADLEVGRRATFEAQVLASDFVSARGRGGRPRRILQVVVGDETGTVNLKWFHGGDALQARVAKGARLRITGEVRRYRFSKELMHPDVEPLVEGEEGPADIVPDYAAPDRVPPRAMRRYVAEAVDSHADLVPTYLEGPAADGLPEAAAALRAIHAPGPDSDPDALAARRTPAHQRLVLEELYLLELGLALRRARRIAEPGLALAPSRDAVGDAVRALPFRLTRAQRRALGEILDDLARPHPMNRLLQGDVGSGKTAVAFLAALAAARAGAQTALMAPTELLAEQHARNLERLAGAAPQTALRTALLTSSRGGSAVRRDLEAGDVDLVVGTHALVQQGVGFARLGLAVIDEQHRFGVLQRAALGARAEGPSPHVLVMTATPIPRTLALTVYGELDVSVIDELPPGRAPVRTEVVREGEGARVVAAIRDALARGEQVYVVYPLVEESEKSDLRAATESRQRIARAFPDVQVDLVHGRLDAAERGAAMARFECGETRILLSTTVVEVGVDVANATLMVVEHAERFGLSQLHQLRGRVGRGSRAGHCVLVARGSSEASEARLQAMLDTTDGFLIAEADLRIRGPGDFLGTRQSGRLPDLRLADLVRDARWVARAREAALDAVRRDPELRRQPALRRAVEGRWGPRLALADVG